jgi:hypothetical protein
MDLGGNAACALVWVSMVHEHALNNTMAVPDFAPSG